MCQWRTPSAVDHFLTLLVLPTIPSLPSSLFPLPRQRLPQSHSCLASHRATLSPCRLTLLHTLPLVVALGVFSPHCYIFIFLPGKPRAPKEIGWCFPWPFEKKLEAACFGRLTQTPSLPDLVLTPASSPSQSLGSRRSLDHHTTTAGLVKIDFARRGSAFTTFCFWIVISSTLSLPKGCTFIASISPLLPPMCCLHRTTCV